MESKKCFKCGEVKPLSAFYRHPMMADGHLGKCKECAKRDARANRAKRSEYYKAFDRARSNDADRVMARATYAKTDAGRAARARARKAYRDRYPLRYEAHVAVGNAIRSGAMKPGPCEVCGHHNVHAHHDDYNKPLDVRWLCEYHHQEWHRHNKAVPII